MVTLLRRSAPLSRRLCYSGDSRLGLHVWRVAHVVHPVWLLSSLCFLACALVDFGLRLCLAVGVLGGMR